MVLLHMKVRRFRPIAVSSRTIQSFDRSRSATRRAISAGASSGIGNTALLDAASSGERAFAIDQCFHDAASAATRRNRVIAVAEDNSAGNFAHFKTREGDAVARVKLAFGVRIIVERRRHRPKGAVARMAVRAAGE